MSALARDATRALIEWDYIDTDYRDEFAHFYAQTFRALPDRCERVHFWDGRGEGKYLGYTSLRPILRRPVCRTLLAPPSDLQKSIACLVETVATPYGFELGVGGFPFISQDYQYGACAHASIWMIALYHHLRFGNHARYHISDIVESARAHQDDYRSIPPGGLSARQITAILHDLRLDALTYQTGELPEGSSMREIAIRYLNSGLPVLLFTPRHTTVLVGYGRQDKPVDAEDPHFAPRHADQDSYGEPVPASKFAGERESEAERDTGSSTEGEADDDPGLFFVRHDDFRGPYIKTPAPPRDPLGNWQAIMIPLPGKIYLAGEAAEEHGWFVFDRECRRRDELKGHLEKLERGEYRTRSYVTQIASYKASLWDRGLPDEVVKWHTRVSGSNWVWVVELQDVAASKEGPDCVVGEVVIDGTSDDLEPFQLFANLPGFMMRWAEPDAPTSLRRCSETQLYRSGCALHVP
jgi:hypothetical protein